MQPTAIQVNQRVRVTQTIHTRSGPWNSAVEGTVLNVSSQPTGSWFAHGKNDRLWLNRLRLQKDDGEVIELILSDESVVSPVKPAAKK